MFIFSWQLFLLKSSSFSFFVVSACTLRILTPLLLNVSQKSFPVLFYLFILLLILFHLGEVVKYVYFDFLVASSSLDWILLQKKEKQYLFYSKSFIHFSV